MFDDYFFWFEMSLLPIILVILGFGAQSARLPAALYLLFYTIIFSLPCLFLILTLVSAYNLLLRTSLSTSIIKWLLILRFLVKIPIFGLHLWLPKAHVESPTIGSRILAGILLKTGIYGVWLLSNWIKFVFRGIWALVGRAVVALQRTVQTDIKRVIALRSVAHLNLRYAAYCTSIYYGIRTLILMALTHGVISSTIFFLAGSSSSQSRLLFWLNGRLITIWLLTLRFNLRLPPGPSFWSEFIRFMCMVRIHIILLFILIAGGIALAWFSIRIWLSLKNQVNFLVNPRFLLTLSILYFILVIWINPIIFL